MCINDERQYNEDNLFGSGSFWGSTNEEENKQEDDEDYEEYYKLYDIEQPETTVHPHKTSSVAQSIRMKFMPTRK